MKLHIEKIELHRNGVSGAPFHVLVFRDPNEGRMLGIGFEQAHHVAGFNLTKLAQGDIAFGSNSRRGDNYEPYLRNAIVQHEGAMTTNPLITERANRYREALIDFLADAMHWCDESGEDFHYALSIAGKHYIAELNGEPIDERRMP